MKSSFSSALIGAIVLIVIGGLLLSGAPVIGVIALAAGGLMGQYAIIGMAVQQALLNHHELRARAEAEVDRQDAAD